jgi:hypothetical protein
MPLAVGQGVVSNVLYFSWADMCDGELVHVLFDCCWPCVGFRYFDISLLLSIVESIRGGFEGKEEV